MIIDCDRCEVRGNACGDCVVGVLLGVPEPSGTVGDEPLGAPSGAPILQLDARERRAIDVLADQGMVPRLRLVAGRARRTSSGSATGAEVRDAG